MSLVATTNTTTSGSIGTFGNTIVGKNQDATCYVGNFDERVTDSMVWELFLQVAPVVSLHIPRDRLNQTHYGYGFVELQSETDADYASKILHGVKLFGKPLRVNKASSDRRNLDVGANLFVGNLDLMVEDSMLMDTFKAFGTVISAKVAKEGEGGIGPSRGFGFVSFDSFEAADTAIESMSGQFLCNRPITVSYAFKKEGKGERHGTAAERLLAAQAKKTMPPPIQNTAPSSMSGYRPSVFPVAGSIPQGYGNYDPNYAAAMYGMQQVQGMAMGPQGMSQQQLSQPSQGMPQLPLPQLPHGMSPQDYFAAQYQQQYAQYQQQFMQQQQQSSQYPQNHQ